MLMDFRFWLVDLEWDLRCIFPQSCWVFSRLVATNQSFESNVVDIFLLMCSSKFMGWIWKALPENERKTDQGWEWAFVLSWVASCWHHPGDASALWRCLLGRGTGHMLYFFPRFTSDWLYIEELKFITVTIPSAFDHVLHTLDHP